MNKTVELVNQWAAFEAGHPDADIADFCRYYLVAKREREGRQELFGGAMPPRADIVIGKLLFRISKLQSNYINLVIPSLSINHFEEFALLNAIDNLKTPRKTEAIYHSINELSTGLNLLANLKKLGYITEHDDPDDKRSRRLRLTPKGEEILRACYERLSKVPEMLYMEMASEDIELCIRLLKNVEIKFSGSWQQHKGKPFEQVYEMVTGKKASSKSDLGKAG
ncbi:MAG TPA: winged helix DNA-binding protein [Puia sp.]